MHIFEIKSKRLKGTRVTFTILKPGGQTADFTFRRSLQGPSSISQKLSQIPKRFLRVQIKKEPKLVIQVLQLHWLSSTHVDRSDFHATQKCKNLDKRFQSRFAKKDKDIHLTKASQLLQKKQQHSSL